MKHLIAAAQHNQCRKDKTIAIAPLKQVTCDILSGAIVGLLLFFQQIFPWQLPDLSGTAGATKAIAKLTVRGKFELTGRV